MNRRTQIAALLLILAMMSCAGIAFLPWLPPGKPGLASIVFFATALGLVGRRAMALRWPGPMGWALIGAALLALPAVVIARGFGRVDMLAVVFHAGMKMEGVGIAALEPEIVQASASLTIFTLSALVLARIWNWRSWALGGLALAMVLANPFVQFAFSGLWRTSVHSDLGAQMQGVPKGMQAGSDILIIYLEGLDRQFADPDLWRATYRPLAELAEQGLSLTHVRQSVATGWSIAGMVASQCGMPLLPNGLMSGNNFNTVDEFLPGVDCLGDVLAPLGYQMEYLVGGDLGFAGFGTFYRSHQFTGITGMNELQAQLPAAEFETALIDWVLDDGLVLKRASEDFDRLAAGPDPFLQVVETVGPHGHKGYLSHNCTASGQGEMSTDFQRVLDCTIADARAFVDHARMRHAQLRPDRALTVLVLSDHLSHNGSLPPPAPAYRAANTVIFLAPGLPSGGVIDREAAMMDVFPTLLEVSGLASPPVAANLGRSLLSPAPTLAESHGLDLLNDMLFGDMDLAAAIWAPMVPAQQTPGDMTSP